MLRNVILAGAVASRSQMPRMPLAAVSQYTLFSTSTEDIKKFVSDVLTTKKFSKQDVDAEVNRLDKGNVKTMELLRKLNMHDWDQLGVSVGAARAIQDALWEIRHNEIHQKTETKMKLRRENSSKLESKQKRL